MSWETLGQLATVISAVVAAATLFSGFQLYRAAKRDEYATNFRTTVTGARASCVRLNALVTYELANELANKVAYSRDLDLVFSDIFNNYFKTNATLPDLEAYLDQLDPITVPVQGPRVELYEQTLVNVETAIAQYQGDFPGLYRVLTSINTAFRNKLRTYKEIVRNEKAFKLILTAYIFKEEKARIDSVERLKQRASVVLGALVMMWTEEDQKDLDDLLKIINLVTDGYLGNTDRQLTVISRRERKLPLTPMSQTETIPQDLREAEKALSLVLSSDKLLDYRELVTRYEQPKKPS